jgi:hypothetical protein
MLNIRGGPREFINIVRKYFIVDSTIATVKENEPEVTALKLGETVLKVSLEIKTSEDDPNKDTVLCMEEIKVIVAIPDGLDIQNAYNRKIYVRSNIRLLAMLKLGNKVFSLGNANIDYHWQLDPPTNAQLATTSLTTGTCDQFRTIDGACQGKEVSIANNVGIFLTAMNKGDVEVNLKIMIHYPEQFKRNRNSFQKKEKMVIEVKLDMDVPEFNGEKGHPTLYLMPPEIEHELRTNKDPNVIQL